MGTAAPSRVAAVGAVAGAAAGVWPAAPAGRRHQPAPTGPGRARPRACGGCGPAGIGGAHGAACRSGRPEALPGDAARGVLSALLAAALGVSAPLALGPSAGGAARAVVAVQKREETVRPVSRLAPRARILQARKQLQGIDEAFVDLIVKDKGFAVRAAITGVAQELGPMKKLAQDLADDQSRDVDLDALLPLLDTLSRHFGLAINWTREADDCWNVSCNVQELDQAHDCMLDAVETLMKLEKL